VTRNAIEIVDYDPAWPDMAAAAIAGLRKLLTETVTEIEHIGSTAVPGLAAKPIIDLMAAAARLDIVEEHDSELADHGYHRHSNGMADRLLYVRSAEQRRTRSAVGPPAISGSCGTTSETIHTMSSDTAGSNGRSSHQAFIPRTTPGQRPISSRN
jgi:GrpB-like predicted nucleotidyltransferase (UPF0157 family)